MKDKDITGKEKLRDMYYSQTNRELKSDVDWVDYAIWLEQYKVSKLNLILLRENEEFYKRISLVGNVLDISVTRKEIEEELREW